MNVPETDPVREAIRSGAIACDCRRRAAVEGRYADSAIAYHYASCAWVAAVNFVYETERQLEAQT